MALVHDCPLINAAHTSQDACSPKPSSTLIISDFATFTPAPPPSSPADECATSVTVLPSSRVSRKSTPLFNFLSTYFVPDICALILQYARDLFPIDSNAPS